MSTVQAHEFALFLQNLSALTAQVKPGSIFTITDADLASRVINVLRLKEGEQFVLFDAAVFAQCTLHEIVSKKAISCQLIARQSIIPIKPELTVLLPILKKDDFYQVLHNCVALGVTTIQLVTTHKMQRTWQVEKELERCKRVLIAGAEQSKNYALPVLKTPLALHQVIGQLDAKAYKIFFDPQGTHAYTVVHDLHTNKPMHVVLSVGPEGDLTDDEKKLLQHHNFSLCALTPTILRSVDALTVGRGLLGQFWCASSAFCI